MIQRRIFTQLHDGSITCSCTAGDRFVKLINFFNDAGFVFHTPTPCLNIFLVTASVRHKHRYPLLDAHPHPSSAAQPGASMLQTRAPPPPKTSILPFPFAVLSPPSASTRSHPRDIAIASTSIPPPLASPRQIHDRVSGSYDAHRASVHVRRNQSTISSPNLPSTDTDEIITEKKEAPGNAKKGKKRKERNAPANIAS
ncbi:hypothetical protein B0H13DRAFT_2286036 [Mycena leptocephala]|nr:hypothetical protein B0H13DRAFT_2286036 [Mycena leptocephala]